MDIELERKAFEAWLEENHPVAGFNVTESECGRYVHRATRMRWEAWQAAVSQAVLEENALLSATLDAVQKLGSGDFILVPREPTEDMLGAAWEAPPAGGPSGNRRVFYEKQTVVYKAMVDEATKEMTEAQEQSHG